MIEINLFNEESTDKSILLVPQEPSQLEEPFEADDSIVPFSESISEFNNPSPRTVQPV